MSFVCKLSVCLRVGRRLALEAGPKGLGHARLGAAWDEESVPRATITRNSVPRIRVTANIMPNIFLEDVYL